MAPAAADAGMYAAAVKWRPSTDPTVVGYRVYTRLASGGYGAGQDVGNPVPAGDGSVSAPIPNLDVRTDYVFAVTAYSASVESGLSNQIPSGYAQVAPLVDSDGDGLKDAAEDVNLNRVVDGNETDPNKADTDGDGVRDATDACRNTPAGAAVNPSGCACSQVTCTDGNACNGVETCTAGVCGPGTPPNCDDGNACTTDACAPATGCTHAAIAGCVPCTTAAQCADANPCTTETCNAGRCASGPAPNGTACSDGNACNGAETCQSGACRAGTALVCNDGNPCTTDTCSPASGCVFAPNTNPCADDGNVCTDDVCGGGACTHPPLANGTTCADANVCDGEETCQSGRCSAAPALDCDDDNACTTDSCSPTTGCAHVAIPGCMACTTASQCGDGNRCTTDACTAGVCAYTTAPNGTACSDGNACNGAETCQAGTCTAGTALVCNDGNPCTTDTCSPSSGCVFTPNANPCTDDGNVCTSDVCSGGSCIHPPVANGTSCSDGDVCDGAETCQSGSCSPGAALNCNDSDACTTDSCAPATGCAHTSIPGCSGCTGDAQCNDGNPCTTDSCTAGACRHTDAGDGTACGDGNLCNGAETCRGGTCRPGTALVCNDGNACTNDSCNPTSGCVATNNTNPCPDDGNACTNDVCAGGSCTHPAKVDGTACGDGNVCNGTEICQGGTCRTATAPTCNDSNPCTTDSCNPTTGCIFTPNTAPCADDTDPCTADVCAAGACTHPPKPNGTPCSDSLFCTIDDTCQGGVCTGGGTNCTQYGTPCKASGCDERRRNCYLTIKPNGTPCGDTDACNGADTCQKGTCAPGRAPDCDDQNPCTTDSCNAATGCVHISIADGTPCSDGVFCNGAEACSAGRCVAPPTPVCDDGNACTDDVCIERDKRCRHDGVDGCCLTDADCADEDACTTGEHCEAGRCASDAVVCPEAEEQCHEAICDAARGCLSTAVRDGTDCDDGDPCTRSDTCTAGACGPPTRKLGAATPIGGLAVTKFVLQPAGKRGVRLTAQGYFATEGPVDPSVSGARLEMRAGQGRVMLDLDLPGEAFRANPSRSRFVSIPPRGSQAALAGLKRLELRLNGPTVDVAVKGFLPAAVGDIASSRASDEVGDPATVAWAIWLGDECVSDPSLHCDEKSNAKRCR